MASSRITMGLLLGVGLLLQGEGVVFAIGEWPPYTGACLPGGGLFTQLVAAACQEAHLEPSFAFYPWMRCENMVKRGEVFATFPYSCSEERKGLHDFSLPILASRVSVVTYAGHPATAAFTFKDIQSLKGLRVGFTVGDPHEKALRNAGIACEPTQTIDQSILKLAAGRIDIIIEDHLVLRDAIRRQYPNALDAFLFSDTDFTPTIAYRVMVSRGHPNSSALLVRFNEGISRARRKGLFERIFEQQGFSRMKAPLPLHPAP